MCATLVGASSDSMYVHFLLCFSRCFLSKRLHVNVKNLAQNLWKLSLRFDGGASLVCVLQGPWGFKALVLNPIVCYHTQQFFGQYFCVFLPENKCALGAKLSNVFVLTSEGSVEEQEAFIFLFFWPNGEENVFFFWLIVSLFSQNEHRHRFLLSCTSCLSLVGYCK